MAGGGSKLMIILILLLGILVGVGGGVGAWMFLSKKKDVPATEEGSSGVSEVIASEEKPKEASEKPKEEAPSHGKSEEKPKEASGGHGAPADAPTTSTASAIPESLVFSFSSDFIVNLADPRWALLVAISLKASTPEGYKEIKENEPQLQDITIRVLSSKMVEDVRTEDGKERLKRDLLGRYRRAIASDAIANVFFTKFTLDNQ